MAKSLSLDIRERVVGLVCEGLSCREAARRVGVSAASTVRIAHRRRQRGSVAPCTGGRRRGSGKLDPVAALFRAEIKTRPDMTMPELVERPRESHGLRAAPAEASRFLKHRLGLANKFSNRNGTTAQSDSRHAIRVAPPPDTEDAH